MRKYCALTLFALSLGFLVPARSAEQLTLGRAVLMAAKNHPDIKVAEANWENEIAQRDLATDPYYPSISGSSGYAYSEAQSAAAGGQNVIRTGYTRQYRLALNASQTLLDFGRTHTAVEVQEKQMQAAEYQLQGKVSDVLLNVATQYFTTLRDQQDILINQDAVRNAQAQLVRAEGFYQAGTKAKIEVTQAEATLATAQIALVTAINAEKVARALLNTSMGNKTFQEYTLREVVVSAPNITQEKVLEIAAETRFDILSQRQLVRAAEAQVANGHAQYFPSISASGTYAWADKSFIPQPYNWNIGLTMSVPIFNEPLLGANVRSYQALLKESQAQLDSTILAARELVVEAYIGLRGAEERCKLSLPGLASAQENYRLASERYQVGVGLSLDVSDAERLLVQARSQELQARFDLQLAIVKLHHEVGDLTLDLMLGAYPIGDPRVNPPPLPSPTPKALPDLNPKKAPS